MSAECRGQDPKSYLFSDDDDANTMSVVWVQDHGSHPRRVEVVIQGLTAEGIVDITIMNGNIFKRVAAVAHLKKDFKRANKMPHTYDCKSFSLDG